MNRVALALDNFLDARRDTEKEGALYEQWTRFTLIQGYRIDGPGGTTVFRERTGLLNH